METRADPLGVLTTTRPVIEQAEYVNIDLDAVDSVARRIAGQNLVTEEWDESLHPSGGRDETANYILLMDALNFCFWGEPRWRVEYKGVIYNGYWALTSALKRAVESGVPLHDAEYLAQIDTETMSRLLAGEGEIPLLQERVLNAREVGQVLLERYDGQFSNAIAQASNSAAQLAVRVIADFSSFRDVAAYGGAEVRFYKRAQILVSDIYGAYGGRDLGAFDDLDTLTAFADYKVPQVLHHLNVLRYDTQLANLLDQQVELAPGSAMEVEIRAGTIWGVEEIHRSLARLGQSIPAHEIDWALWQFGQDLPDNVRPYHRTRTIYY